MVLHGDHKELHRTHVRGPVASAQTAVFQSCASNASSWVDRCMTSVRDWTLKRGWNYIRIEDSQFLASTPKWYHDKCQDYIQPLTDLARLETALFLLGDGYTRVVWVDADLVVFSPDEFDLPEVANSAFVREIWLNPPNAKRPASLTRVNNSVAVFAAGGTFLPFYRDACLTIADNTAGQLPKSGVGTDFLTTLHELVPLRLLDDVGNLSPYVLNALVRESTSVLHAYNNLLDKPIVAVNLCSSHENRAYLGTSIRNCSAEYDRAVDLLLATQGAAFRSHRPESSQPAQNRVES
jgi:hypothetical protein